ncbi:hypothetical protein Q8A73_007555 [Channa argus]|nr:hypothetical protein Q8A73_007555 [Channa argus]
MGRTAENMSADADYPTVVSWNRAALGDRWCSLIGGSAEQSRTHLYHCHRRRRRQRGSLRSPPSTPHPLCPLYQCPHTVRLSSLQQLIAHLRFGNSPVSLWVVHSARTLCTRPAAVRRSSEEMGFREPARRQSDRGCTRLRTDARTQTRALICCQRL